MNSELFLEFETKSPRRFSEHSETDAQVPSKQVKIDIEELFDNKSLFPDWEIFIYEGICK